MMRMKKIGLSLLLLLSVTTGYGQREYDQFFLEAMMQRQKGNNDAAFDLLRHCLEINPDAPEAYYFLAQYYNALKDGEKSLAYIQKAAALDPDNATYMETLAQAYIRQQDYEAAIPVVEKIYERDKGDAVPTVSAGGRFRFGRRGAEPYRSHRWQERTPVGSQERDIYPSGEQESGHCRDKGFG